MPTALVPLWSRWKRCWMKGEKRAKATTPPAVRLAAQRMKKRAREDQHPPRGWDGSHAGRQLVRNHLPVGGDGEVDDGEPTEPLELAVPSWLRVWQTVCQASERQPIECRLWQARSGPSEGGRVSDGSDRAGTDRWLRAVRPGPGRGASSCCCSETIVASGFRLRACREE
jgi:hypothetical protein